MNSYALFNSSNSIDWVVTGSFCFFRRVFNPRFAGDRHYCDIAAGDQGWKSSLTINK
jgi:hypothetical protein